MSKIAIVTGYSSGIGKAICEALTSKDCYRIIPLNSRLDELDQLEKEVKYIVQSNDIDLLVNCAGVGVFRPHEELSVSTIRSMIDVNLTGPLVLSNLLLRSLKKTKGHIINISSIEATRHSKFSALYSATKSGLRHFSLTLFEELRKAGVRVTSINPDITQTAFFDKLPFEPSQDPQSFLDPNEVAQTVMDILSFEGVITDITLRPQKFSLNKKQPK